LGIGGALWVLFLGRIIDGVTGGNISTIYAYMADITEPKDRGRYFGFLGAAAGFGMVFGPVIGGFTSAISLSAPLYIAALITALDLAFGFFILKESLKDEHRAEKFDFGHLNPLKQFGHIFSIRILRRLFLIGFLFFLGINAMYGINSVFLKDVFSWSPFQIGILLFVVGLVDIFSQGFLVRKLMERFSATIVAIIGLGLTCGGFIVAATSSAIVSTVLIYFGIIVLNMGDGVFEPSFNSLISTSVGPKVQGRVQGANQGMQSIARIVGPFMAAWAYQSAHGLPYAIDGFLMILAFIVIYYSINIIKTHKADQQASPA
jgi:DHA1 family tetracycline resistance protein-like MFS transporter